MNSASVTAQCLSKRHDHTSRAGLALAEASSARCSCFSRVRLDARPVSAASDTGSRAAAPAFERRVDSFAQERRNVSSSARAPKIAMASDQSARASAWGHSSSHTALFLPVRRRRSWATMASCQADKRAPSDVASFVPRPEPSIRYRFMSHPPPLAARVRHTFNSNQVSRITKGHLFALRSLVYFAESRRHPRIDLLQYFPSVQVVGRLSLNLLEEAAGHAAGVRQDVRDDENPAILEQPVRLRCRLSVRPFRNDSHSAVDTRRTRGCDLVLHCGGYQDVDVLIEPRRFRQNLVAVLRVNLPARPASL